MLPHESCPEPARLKDLIDGSLPDDERTVLVAHLDACSSCQRALEEQACGGSSVLSAACHIRERPPAQSAYWVAVQRVAEATPVPAWGSDPVATRSEPASSVSDSSTEEVALDFLQPSDHPEFLGKLGHFNIVGVIG